jgi:hypothetical protein
VHQGSIVEFRKQKDATTLTGKAELGQASVVMVCNDVLSAPATGSRRWVCVITPQRVWILRPLSSDDLVRWVHAFQLLSARHKADSKAIRGLVKQIEKKYETAPTPVRYKLHAVSDTEGYPIVERREPRAAVPAPAETAVEPSSAAKVQVVCQPAALPLCVADRELRISRLLRELLRRRRTRKVRPA